MSFPKPLLFLILIIGSKAVAKKSMYWNMTDLCVISDPTVLFGSSTVVPGTNGYNNIDANLTLVKDFPRNMFIQWSVTILNRVTGKYSEIFTSKRNDFCKLLAKPTLDPLFSNNLKAFATYTDLMTTCRPKKGTYVLRSFNLDQSLFPSFAPNGAYRVWILFSYFSNRTYNDLAKFEIYFDYIK